LDLVIAVLAVSSRAFSVVSPSVIDRRCVRRHFVYVTVLVRLASLCVGDFLFVCFGLCLYNTQALPMVLYTCCAVFMVRFC